MLMTTCFWIDFIRGFLFDFYFKSRMAFWRGASLFSSSTPSTTTPNDTAINQETVMLDFYQ
jgi:hypothetical protein